MRRQDPWTILTSVKQKKKEEKRIRECKPEEVEIIVRELMKLAEKEFATFDFDVLLEFQQVGDFYFWDDTVHGGFHGPKHKLVLNSDWYEKANDEEIIHAIWHEIYHLYQWSQIEKMHEGKEFEESEEKILTWQYEMAHYKRMSKPAQLTHLNQILEEDAYEFSFYMMLKYGIENPEQKVEMELLPEKKQEFLKRAVNLLEKI